MANTAVGYIGLPMTTCTVSPKEKDVMNEEADNARDERPIKILPYEQYKAWYHILFQDDIEEYERFKDTIENEEFSDIINGRFEFEIKGNVVDCDFSRPFILANSFHSLNCVRRLVEDGVHIYSKDLNNYSVAHALVLVAKEQSVEEQKLCVETLQFLMSLISLEGRVQLLESEDNEHFRPIERACMFGTYGMLKAMLEIDGYLLKEKIVHGIVSSSSYDVTEYESNPVRSHRSPMRFLLYLDEERIDDFLEFGILKIPLITEWIRYKKRKFRFLLVIWFIIRFINIACLVFFDPNAIAIDVCKAKRVTNASDAYLCMRFCDGPELDESEEKILDTYSDINYDMLIVTSFICAIILICDMIDFVANFFNRDRKLALSNIFSTPKQFVSYTKFYRISQFILCIICLFMIVFGHILVWNHLVPLDYVLLFVFYMKCIYLPFALIGIMFILEWLPVIGNFAISLKRMISTLIKFLLSGLLVYICFGIFFMQIYNGNNSGLQIGPYYLFLYGLGIKTLPDNTCGYALVTYMCFYYFNAVLLINYFIAMMSSQVIGDRHLNLALQNLRVLDAVFILEDKFGWIMSAISRKINSGQTNSINLIVEERLHRT